MPPHSKSHPVGMDREPGVVSRQGREERTIEECFCQRQMLMAFTRQVKLFLCVLCGLGVRLGSGIQVDLAATTHV